MPSCNEEFVLDSYATTETGLKNIAENAAKERFFGSDGFQLCSRIYWNENRMSVFCCELNCSINFSIVAVPKCEEPQTQRKKFFNIVYDPEEYMD